MQYRAAILKFSSLAVLALVVSGCATSAVGMSSMNGMGGMSHTSTSNAQVADAASTATAYAAPPELRSRNGKLAVTLTAADQMVRYNGADRWAMTYNGLVTGPTLRIRPGDHLTITLINNLPEMTSLHTHGLHVNPNGNGDNPLLTIEPGQQHTYEYEIPKTQQPGTFWYHPHAHGIVAKQVNLGLEGAIIVENDVDAALAKVSTDRVLVVTDPPLVTSDPWPDATHNAGGMGGMMGGNHDAMMMAMMGRSGPRLLANGSDGVALTGAAGKLERVHLINATASTRLRFTWTGTSIVKLATDGGRLPRALTVQTFDLAPGERTEVALVSNGSAGQLSAQRVSAETTNALTGSAELIATTAADAGTDAAVLPKTLNAPLRNLFAANVKIAKTRTITLTGHMQPLIDGRPFDATKVNFTAKKGTVEEWVIKSQSPMDHPMHLHVWPFQIKGEAGWHDIVQIPANTTKVIRVAYDDIAGTTVIHCHILDHEDNGMMAIIKVV